MFNKFFTRFMPLMDTDGGSGGGAGGAGGSGGAGEGGTGGSAGGQPTTTPEFDYEKLAGIIAGKQKVSEESILKAHFKNQGLSPEEAKEAIAAFKEQRAKNTPDVAALQQQTTQAQQAAITANVEKEAILMHEELGVDLKTMPYLLKLADMTDVVQDGNIDKEKLKEALNKVLEDVPSLKGQAEENNNGGYKFGAGGGGGRTDATNEKLDRIFGVNKK